MSLWAGGSKYSVSGPDGHGNLAAVLILGRADCLQQRQHGTPLDVVARRMLEDLAQRVALMVTEVRWLRGRRHSRSRPLRNHGPGRGYSAGLLPGLARLLDATALPAQPAATGALVLRSGLRTTL